jgi:hypothetical protein
VREDELGALLRSRALALEPPADLVASTRARAQRIHRRRRAGMVAVTAAAVAAVLAGTGLVGGADGPPETVATDAGDPRFPAATTPVVVLSELNGGEVVTFFEGRAWCTAAVRSGTAKACSRALGSGVPPFAFLRAPGNETLTVDRDTLVAGVLGTGVAEVRITLSDGRELTADDVKADGFPQPVWWMQVAPDTAVTGYTAYDAAGGVVATMQVTGESSTVEAEPTG